jgi:Sugar-transfer associated ATP-grasp
VADNFAVGGIACSVSLEGGVLGIGVFKSSVNRDRSVRTHPDSGAAIEGQSLPHWPAVKELAVAAHTAFPRMPSVGWDIAITDDGPVLLEGSGVWCVDLAQMSHRLPLGKTPIPSSSLK